MTPTCEGCPWLHYDLVDFPMTKCELTEKALDRHIDHDVSKYFPTTPEWCPIREERQDAT